MKYKKMFFNKVKTKINSGIYWLSSSTFFYRYLLKITRGEFLKNTNNIDAEKKIALIITPWFFTPAPFFSIIIGIFLSKRNVKVDFIIDDLEFGASVILFKIQLGTIKFLAKKIPNHYKIVYVSRLPPVFENVIINDDYIRDLSMQNTIHYMKGELKIEGREKYFNKVYDQLYKARPHIYSFFTNSVYDRIFLSGGIAGTSGLYLKYGDHFNVSKITFDAGFGVLLSSVNGVAAHLSDIPVAFNLFNLDPAFFEKKVFVKQYVSNQILARRNGVDAFNSQIIKSNVISEIDNVGVLILLNSSWDSAALGIHSIFNSYVGWLMETIDFLTNHTRQTITIRQHPSERFESGRSNDDFKAHIKEKFGKNDRINFIDCYSEINTYNLIEKCNLVICFSSTSGIEAAIFGKTTIVASNCYYSNLDFVYKPSSIHNYHTLITDGLEKKIVLTTKQIELAIICYYLGQCCNWIFTDFTPMPSDYLKWVNMPCEELYNSETVQLYIESIETATPISFLISKIKLSEVNHL